MPVLTPPPLRPASRTLATSPPQLPDVRQTALLSPYVRRGRGLGGIP